MAYAAELVLDTRAAGILTETMQHLERSAGIETPHMLGAVPHLSLAVWEAIDPGLVWPRLENLARSLDPPPLRLASLGLFGGASAVLFAAPVPTPALLACHAAFHQAMADFDAQCWPYYRPGAWMPHVTLASGLDATAIGAAAAAAAPGWTAIDATATALGLLRFRPIETLHCVALGRGGAGAPA